MFCFVICVFMCLVNNINCKLIFHRLKPATVAFEDFRDKVLDNLSDTAVTDFKLELEVGKL